MPGYHLAQLNIARALAPLDGEQLAGFQAALDPINALADAAPGFVWRLQDEDGDATTIRAYDDDLMIVNFSLWVSRQALWDFVYASGHLGVMRRRREWFSGLGRPHLGLWWVAEGTKPSLDDAVARLAHLDRHGPSAQAFTFKDDLPPPG